MAAAAAAGGAHLVTVRDECSVAVWFSAPGDGPDPVKLAAALRGSEGPAPRVALGRATGGLAGFRTTHWQAEQARQVAVAAGAGATRLTWFADVAAVALMCADLAGARSWVVDVLGPLAGDDENAERLRATALVFFDCGSSYSAAAEVLCLHKNSVLYRIQKAEQLRGRPFKPDRFHVEFALRACQVLGPAVLLPTKT